MHPCWIIITKNYEWLCIYNIFILFLYILLYLVFLYLFDIIFYLKNTLKIVLFVSQFLILSKNKVSQLCLYESDFNLSQCDCIFIVKLYNIYSEAEMASMYILVFISSFFK